MYAEDREKFSELLSQQATAMVVLAAQFEQAADLARTGRGGQVVDRRNRCGSVT
jgi:hypothetical protein